MVQPPLKLQSLGLVATPRISPRLAPTSDKPSLMNEIARQSHVRAARPACFSSRQRDRASRGVALNKPLVLSRDLRISKYKGSCVVPRFFVQQLQLSTLLLHSLVTCFAFESSPRRSTTAIMFATPAGTKLLYTGAAAYATCTAFAAFWVGLRLPVQHNKAGPFNYHKLIKAGRRVPWRRLPRAL